MLGTYGLFLLVGNVADVPNLFKLTLFVLTGAATVAIGYWLNVATHTREYNTPAPLNGEGVKSISLVRRLVTIGAVYYILYAVVNMGTFGVASPGAVLRAINDPGAAYQLKFDATEAQINNGTTSTSGQIITLVAVLGAPLVPMLVVYWRKIGLLSRILGILAIFLYGCLYIAIGTLVGLGNILILGAVGYLVNRARAPRPRRKRSKRQTILVVLAGLAFVGYMSYNQAGRLQPNEPVSHFAANPAIASVTGEKLARGVSATFFYPTHGYLGLSYDLEMPFEWTYGRGSSGALDGYLKQYGFGAAQKPRTYPDRAQAVYGLDPDLYWSTIYPWIASDLTFPGALGFMGMVGWWMARWWREAVFEGRKLSLLLLGQIGILVAFIPANNQIVLSRGPFLTVLCLLLAYAFSAFNKRNTPRLSRGPEKLAQG